MACTSDWRDAIGELAGGRLGAQDVDELLAHVATCAACSAELDAVAALTSTAALEARGHPAPARLRLVSRWLLLPAAALLAWIAFGLWRGPVHEPGPESLAILAPFAPAGSVLRGPELAEAERARWTEAMSAYAAGDWEAAVRLLAELAPEAGRRRALARLYEGIALAQLERFDAAVASLEVAAAEGADLVRQRAQWYLANVQLRMGRSLEAHAGLEAIRREGGEYELNAAALLSELKAFGDE